MDPAAGLDLFFSGGDCFVLCVWACWRRHLRGPRRPLEPSTCDIVRRKLLFCLQTDDLPGYRRHLNLQSAFLLGLEIQPLRGVLPDSGDDDPVVDFMYQNGFSSVHARDSAGWCPLHYAALSGHVPRTPGQSK